MTTLRGFRIPHYATVLRTPNALSRCRGVGVDAFRHFGGGFLPSKPDRVPGGHHAPLPQLSSAVPFTLHRKNTSQDAAPHPWEAQEMRSGILTNFLALMSSKAISRPLNREN